MLQALNDRVIVRKDERQEVSPGGIHLVDAARERPTQGTVVAVGPGKYLDGQRVPLSVKVGDRVLFGKFIGNEIEENGEKLYVMKEDDILGVFDE